MPSRLRGAVVTIGNFDGVHLGHRALMDTLRQRAVELGDVPTLAITFEPHPLKLLSHGQAPERITGMRGKARWLDDSGVDGLFVLRFTRRLAALSPAQFVREVLVDGLGVRAVLVGTNFRFGAGGQGNCATLTALGTEWGFAVYCQSLLEDGQQVISSTRIRELIKTSRFAEVATLLGRPFEIEGRVIHGHQRGRSLGFPTANLALTDLLHPPLGVYVVESRLQEQWLPAVANLGRNPTFGGTHPQLEVHLLADCGNLYHQVMRVRFLHCLRDERSFADSDALRAQIAVDVQQAQTFFATRTAGRS
ncbi:MAG: riboflavin biosynthesis protein RibF [Magnetococcus sp. DMHC-8]